MKEEIVHFTESLGGGVLSAIELLSETQNSSGYSVSLLYLRRQDTPEVLILRKKMPTTRLVELGNSSLLGLLKIFWFSALLGICSRKTIIHAHSSWAGIAVRLAGIVTFNRKVYYTPHGYAFLRTNLPAIARSGILAVENFLNFLSRGMVLSCGVHEGQLAIASGARRMSVLSNYIDPRNLPNLDIESMKSNPPTVIAIGRICEQKNPLRFQRVISKVTIPAVFLWVGDGDPATRSELESSKIQVTGWLGKDEVLVRLSKASILVISSDWEGMPIVAIEALALGIPIVAFYIKSLEEIIQNGQTGYLCASESEMINAIESLLKSNIELGIISKNSKERFYTKYDVKHLRESWQKIYGIESSA